MLRSLLMRPLRYLNGRTLCAVPAEPGQTRLAGTQKSSRTETEREWTSDAMDQDTSWLDIECRLRRSCTAKHQIELSPPETQWLVATNWKASSTVLIPAFEPSELVSI